MSLERREQQKQECIKEMEAVFNYRETSKTKLIRITELSARRPRIKFNNLSYLINEETLRECHSEISGKKSVGIDKVTKEEYGKELEENLKTLVESIKKHSYKPQPSRLVEIPKPNGGKRQLGIASHEDKLVQMAMNKILKAVYENEFIGNSYGFRENKSCHEAIKEADRIVMSKTINYVVEIDIEKFFDTIDHAKLIKGISYRVNDFNLIRLIWRMLKAGTFKDGKRIESTEGIPQGSIVSPMIANIFLHWSIDKWFERIKKQIKGKTDYIRYADDMLFFFQYKAEAENFLKLIETRLENVKLKMNKDKSKIVFLNRYKISQKQSRATEANMFNFLGFSHYFGKSVKSDKTRLKRITQRKTLRKRLEEFHCWIKSVRNTMKFGEIIELAKSKIRGHFQYYGVSDNSKSIKHYYNTSIKKLYFWLNRRSQKRSFNWDKFNEILEKFKFPKPKIYCNIFKFCQTVC